MGRPSVDPDLMIRMLVVGYVFAIRSERLICREVQVNLAYSRFCKLGIEDGDLGDEPTSMKLVPNIQAYSAAITTNRTKPVVDVATEMPAARASLDDEIMYAAGVQRPRRGSITPMK